MQPEILSNDQNSDCGTDKTIDQEITAGNIQNFVYRYIKEGKDLVQITNENKNNYIGKTVKMRSPLFCRGIGNPHVYCSRCFGGQYYITNKENVGLLSSVTSGTVSNLNLQKFHENEVKLTHIDIEDMLI